MAPNPTRIARRPLLAGTAAFTARAVFRPAQAETPSTTPLHGAQQSRETDMIRLDGPGATLLLLRHPRGLPEIAYWGIRLPDDLDAAGMRGVRAPSRANNALDVVVPEATLIPTIGPASLSAPALAAHRAGLDWTAAFDVQEVRRDAGSCVLVGRDPVARIAIELHLELGEDDVLSARNALTNEGEAGLVVERLASGVFLMPAEVEEVRVFEGRWGR